MAKTTSVTAPGCRVRYPSGAGGVGSTAQRAPPSPVTRSCAHESHPPPLPSTQPWLGDTKLAAAGWNPLGALAPGGVWLLAWAALE